MLRIYNHIIVACFVLFFCSCNSTEPDNKINLSLVDVSCTEVWLQVTGERGKEIRLLRDDKEIKSFILAASPMIIYDDSLEINTSYSYQVIRTDNGEESSIKAVTLDTTSHNYTWQTFTLGGYGGSSTLYDVAIIDKNNIWAVGEIYINDSIGNPDPSFYNLIKWDGAQWKPERVYFKNSYGQSFLAPMKSIFAFSANDIWIGLDQVIYWNGTTYKSIELPDAVFQSWINKIWGRSSNDLYVVGNGGNIAHYENGSWTKIESGTDVDLQDISGTPDLNEIWTCGWDYNNGRVSLLKIDKNNVESIWDSQTNTTLNTYRGTLNSLYANGNKEFVLVGGQIFRHSLVDKRQVKYEWVKTSNGSKVLELGNYGYRIKGSSKNNIAIAGDAAMIWHFNGAAWYKYSELYDLDDRLYGLAVTDNVVVAVGKRYSPGTLGGALVLIGRR
jgi:hypothetical protein